MMRCLLSHKKEIKIGFVSFCLGIIADQQLRSTGNKTVTSISAENAIDRVMDGHTLPNILNGIPKEAFHVVTLNFVNSQLKNYTNCLRFPERNNFFTDQKDESFIKNFQSLLETCETDRLYQGASAIRSLIDSHKYVSIVVDHYLSNYKSLSLNFADPANATSELLNNGVKLIESYFSHLRTFLDKHHKITLPSSPLLPGFDESTSRIAIAKLHELDPLLPAVVARTYYLLGRKCVEKQHLKDAYFYFTMASLLSRFGDDLEGRNHVPMEAILSLRSGLYNLEMIRLEEAVDKNHKLDISSVSGLLNDIERLRANYQELRCDNRTFYDIVSDTNIRMLVDPIHHAECTNQMIKASLLKMKLLAQCNNKEQELLSVAQSLITELCKSEFDFSPLNGVGRLISEKRQRLYLVRLADVLLILRDAKIDWKGAIETNTLFATESDSNKLWNASWLSEIRQLDNESAVKEICNKVVRSDGNNSKDRAAKEASMILEKL